MAFSVTLLICLLHSFQLALAHPKYAHEHFHNDKRFLFDFSDKPVEVTGDHAFQPPTKGDQRGPCPGLNALANHGYISREGIASLGEVTAAINSVYGMGLDLGGLLATLGVVWAGAPVSLDPRFSIGGADPAVNNLLDGVLGILGEPQGIDQTHNLIESDSSPTRDDLYVTGDAHTMNFSTFKRMLAAIPQGADGVTTSNAMADFAAQRFHESVASNPNFYYGPFTGTIARNAGYLFIVNMLSNHSSTEPGTLNDCILKSFFGVTGSGLNMTYQVGHERIPENWYRRKVDYGLVELNLDLVAWITRHPVLASIGGNMGSPNTFTGLDLSHPVQGLFNVPKLLEGNNLLCFTLNLVELAAPSYLNNLFETLTQPLGLILDALHIPLLDLDCGSTDALTKGGKPVWEELSDKFPGAKVGGIGAL